MKKHTDGFLARALPHLTLVLALLLLVLFVLDRFNNNMAFLSNEISKWLIGAASALAVATSVLLIGAQWRAEDEAERRRLHALERRRAKAAPAAAASAEPEQPAVPAAAAPAEPEQAAGGAAETAPSNG